MVAPYVGAWIETRRTCSALADVTSHPMWVRGLKHNALRWQSVHQVAPYVGAWIETCESIHRAERRAVAPYVGAWIETRISAAR